MNLSNRRGSSTGRAQSRLQRVLWTWSGPGVVGKVGESRFRLMIASEDAPDPFLGTLVDRIEIHVVGGTMATGGVSQSIAELEVHLEVLRDANELRVRVSRAGVGGFLEPTVAIHGEGVELLLRCVGQGDLDIVPLISTCQRGERITIDGRIKR